MEKNLISIIIPIYNAEKYLGECLNSILLQTYQNFEIILVDDSSTDSSLQICHNYAIKDSRIKVYTQNNNACGPTRNEGLRHAKGDYIAFIDDDDLIPKNYLEVLLKNSNGVDIPYVEYVILGEKRKKRKGIDIIRHKNILTRYFKEKNLYLVSAWGKLFPKSFVSDLSFVSGYMEDVPVIYKVLLKANNLIRCNEIYYIYRKREGSLTTDPNIKKYLSVLCENTPMIESDLKKRKVKISVLRAFYYRKINGYLTFLKKTNKSTDGEIIQAIQIIRKDIKKHFLKYMLISRLKISFQLLLYTVSPTLFFNSYNLLIKIKKLFAKH